MKFIMLINFKMPTIVGILKFMTMIHAASDHLKQNNSLFLSILDFMSNFMTSMPASLHTAYLKGFNYRFLFFLSMNTIRLPKSFNSNALMDLTCVQTVANILAHQIGFSAVCTYVRKLLFAHWIRISDILPWDRKSYLAHAILPKLSREDSYGGFIRTHAHGRQVTSLLC